MFTVCPKCTLTLAVTANDLRVGQGYVRCGRCSNVFNALLKLSEAPPDTEGAAPSIVQADPASNSQITRAISSADAARAGSSAAAPSPSRAAQAPAPGAAGAAAMRPASTPASPGSAPGSAPPAAASAAVRSESPRINSPRTDPPKRQTDTEGIDQFETVLKTLGLTLVDDEPPPYPTDEASTEPAYPARDSPDSPGSPDSPDGPTRTVENIVLEGDEISQSEGEVPDKPLDELEIFTRRMSFVTDGAESATTGARSPPLRSPSARSPSARPPSARPPSARAPLPSRPTSTHRAPAGPGPDAPGEMTFEEQALLDDALLDDRTLDEPIEGESGEDLSPTEDAAVDFDLPSFRTRASPHRWAWIAACIALGLLLIVQAMDHWRDRLATSALWGAPVRQLYAAIGAPLASHWDLESYEVRQQGAEFEPGGRQTIRVRFSVANHAARAQPVPLLRLTLLDRYGRRVAQRDLAPTDYWPPGHAPAALLSSDQRVDTEVQVRDPSADSASFELDVCLRDPQGLIHCAGDANTAGGSESGAL